MDIKTDLRTMEAPVVPPNVAADLLRIGGTNEYGEPKVRIVHGCHETWFRYDKVRLKYPVRRIHKQLVAWNVKHINTGEEFTLPPGPQPEFSVDYLVSPVWDTKEMGYPGWILEEWWPPEVVCGTVVVGADGQKKFPQWEMHRWDIRNGKKLDVLGEPPVRGQYRFMLYLDDGAEPTPKPLEITDHRIIEIVERAVYLRQGQAGADGWRKIQSVEKARELQRFIQEDRDKENQASVTEFQNLLEDVIGGYAQKMRGAYLS